MTVPYHLLKVCGSTVFAAQGSDIHSFTSTLEYISTWKYPLKQADAPSGPSTDAPGSPAIEGPPAKRRKVQNNQDSPSSGHAAEASNGQGKTKKNYQENPTNERPFIQGLYATTDGRYLIAITGSDKTIWVFEHDGAGNLNQLSQRTMPKRPCALALTSDSRTILSADKFGDVYALPLIPSSPALPQSQVSQILQPQPQSRSSTPASSTPTPAPPPFKPQANELTVHTKRNLKALENQKISLGRKAAAATADQHHQQDPPFEHTLILGHVSMLTAICVGTVAVRAEDDGGTGTGAGARARTREYILTADRDEHIRVSRGIPQAHVIEGFCLGHDEFVSRLCVAPGGRERVLVSGGGDDDLFVWDWVEGRMLCRAGLLGRAKEVVGDRLSRVAVTRLLAYGGWGGEATAATAGVFVVCERVPALFHYQLLDDNTLRHYETIRLPGNPLDVEILGPGRLLVAVDTSASSATEGNDAALSSLIVLDKDAEAEAGWRRSHAAPRNVPEAVSLSAEELQKILYSTESLRKLTDFD
ncbi:tRNA (guanine-N(7)-)-methyltransferase non-catalytic subunit trm82 [Madurella fahalii]|uniref:tRNA (Guanine-N(7)-)-methyltransferase non-catalytic subunit trm82 n=1 Tax=Madurella fahalii TaxID=1157608 RepID=A0ABQ0FZL9_9PEZI